MPLDDLIDIAAHATDIASNLSPNEGGRKKSGKGLGANRVFWAALILGLVIAFMLFVSA